MTEGTVVVVLGRLDQRIRSRSEDELNVGTICCMASPDHIWVLMADFTIWYGPAHDLALYEDQSDLVSYSV